MFCIKCGNQMQDGAAFCSKCGSPVNEVVGQSSNTTAGQIVIANNAFNDGRYDEAYQLFAQLYAQNQSDSQVSVRLGLATAAKDYFNNGIPNSTKELFSKGLSYAKTEATSYDDFVSKITTYIYDAKKVVDDTKTVVAEGISSAVNQTAPMRSAGSIVADALFSPMVSANRNLYEDKRTADNNLKIINNAIANKKIITATLDDFRSIVFKIVADMLTEPLNNDNPLYITLGDFVINGEDAKIYEKLSANSEIQNSVYGLCYGEEKTLLDFKDVCCFLKINEKNHANSFTLPKGHLLMTNYKVVYKAVKDKCSFEKPLNELVRVEVGGPLNTHIVLIFPNNVKVLISPLPVGTHAMYVAAINEDLKMPNR